MAEIVNLRRARKTKAREEGAAKAGANRTKHGVAKAVRDLGTARGEKEKQNLEAHRLKDKD
jgi:hypothetical protein